MRIAKAFSSASSLDVSLLGVGYCKDDTELLPDCFFRTPHLTRSICDLKQFNVSRRLPILRDILDRLYYHSTAEWLIYTNSDIGVQPFFYDTVLQIINQGYDAFVINRRILPDHYTSCTELPLMYSDIGRPHPGHDCFVFRREAYPKYRLGDVCIGISWVGRILLWNLCAHSAQFHEFKDRHMTFHIGHTAIWQSDKFSDYRAHNESEARKALTTLQDEVGPFPPESAITPYLI